MTSNLNLAKWASDTTLSLKRCSLTHQDLEWMMPVKQLKLWNVKVPLQLLASLPSLEWLDICGGSGENINYIKGCKNLKYLQINQISGLTDVAVINDLKSIQLLSLYGLPKVIKIPSLDKMVLLKRIQIGSMKGLMGLTGIFDAPNLQELMLLAKVGVADDDASRIANSSIKSFEWHAYGVPDKIWVPFTKSVDKPITRTSTAEQWFEEQNYNKS